MTVLSGQLFNFRADGKRHSLVIFVADDDLLLFLFFSMASSVPCTDSFPCDTKRKRQDALPPEDRLKVQRRRVTAIVRKYLRHGLLLPELPEGWLVQDLPHTPLDFGSQFVLPLHKPKLLRFLFPHCRDCRVKFYPEDHIYEIDGVPTLGSVTALVHAFCESFDSSTVIPRMQASANWPRQGYLKQVLSDDVIDQLRQIPDSEELLSSLFWLGEDEQQIAVAAQQLKYMHPKFAHVIDLLALDAAQIKSMWEANGTKSANQGTWMHYTFELFLNCDRVNLNTPEMNLFLVFLGDLSEHRAFRTEWEIFGEDEQLAGSVDLVVQARDGSLVIVDWKRTANLSAKYQLSLIHI